MRFRCLAVAMLTTPAFAASPQSEGFRKLTGGQIRAAFAGKIFTDDTHYAFAYRANGQIGGMSMGKAVAETWKVTNDQLCITAKTFGETCHKVWKKGTSVRLQIGDADFTIDGTLR